MCVVANITNSATHSLVNNVDSIAVQILFLALVGRGLGGRGTGQTHDGVCGRHRDSRVQAPHRHGDDLLQTFHR